MYLRQSVLELMQLLQAQGFSVWAVGGCVRDDLLGITPHDYDLCTDALPEQMMEVFSQYRLVLAGLKHGTVGVVTPEDVVEITTFRAEGAYADSRHPGWVRFVGNVEEDLARRDFTVNAIAYCPELGYRDPFGGRQDLQKGILRCVGDPKTRFQEDALRILRGARFAARFGLTIEPETWTAMVSCAPLLRSLARERVLQELEQLVCLVDGKMLSSLVPILIHAIPELEPMVNFDQRSPHHAYDVFTHTAHVVESVEPVAELRLAALLHDVGKPACFTMDENGRGHFYDHAKVGGQMADRILQSLKAPTAVREEVVWLVEHHMLKFLPERKAVRRMLSRYGKTRLQRLLSLHRGDLLGKGTGRVQPQLEQLEEFSALMDQIEAEEGRLTLKNLAVKGNDLLELGMCPGQELGQTLNRLLNAVLSEEVPNEKEALLELVRSEIG